MKILAFGIVKEIFGSSSIDLSDGDISVDTLKRILEEQYPALKKLSSFMIAVNSEYAPSDSTICAGDEIAIIPPVSGG